MKWARIPIKLNNQSVDIESVSIKNLKMYNTHVNEMKLFQIAYCVML